MNIFYTNPDPIACAHEHCHVHQIKMIVEYAQLLSTAHAVIDGDYVGYKPTHVNHPSAIWVRQSADNYEWLWECAITLCELYARRTDKEHKTEAVLWNLRSSPRLLAYHGITEPSIAAPPKYKLIAIARNVDTAYQAYLNDKFAEWKSRDKPLPVVFDEVPEWYVEKSYD